MNLSKSKSENDNRMAWIRNLDKLSEKESGFYTMEHEIVSECRIPGVLYYEGGKIACGGYSPLEKDRNGLYHYFLRVQYPNPKNYNKKANEKGYYFKDGIAGELISIFSLHFQCRFYLVSTHQGEFTCNGLKTKIDHDFLYKPTPNLSLIHISEPTRPY